MKVWNYMAIMLGMMIFLALLGFNLTTGDNSNEILGNAGVTINETTGESTVDVAGSSWFSKLFDSTDGIIALIGLGGAIALGIFGKQLDWKLVLLPFMTAFGIKFVRVGKAITDLVSSYGNEAWLTGIIITIFGTLTVMFVFSIIEWFGGSGAD